MGLFQILTENMYMFTHQNVNVPNVLHSCFFLSLSKKKFRVVVYELLFLKYNGFLFLTSVIQFEQ